MSEHSITVDKKLVSHHDVDVAPRELEDLLNSIKVGGIDAVQVEDIVSRFQRDLPNDTLGSSLAKVSAEVFIKHAAVLCSQQASHHVEEASNIMPSQEVGLFGLLSDDLLDECFSFLGKGHFLYVGTTCKRFKTVYYKDDVRNEEYIRNKETFYENAAWSVSCAKMCLEESQDNKQDSFKRIAKMAGKQGRVKVVEWIHSHEKLSCGPLGYLNPAAHSGQLEVLEWAEKKGLFQDDPFSIIRNDVAEAAAETGQVKVLDFMHTHDLGFSVQSVCLDACMHGQVTVFEWMKERHLLNESESYSCVAAIEARVNVLDWLYDNGFEVDLNVVVCVAFGYQRLQVLLWTWRHGLDLDENHYSSFVDYLDGPHFDSYFDLFQALLEVEECPWGRAVIQYAQATGNQLIVNWAVENGWVDENGAFLAH